MIFATWMVDGAVWLLFATANAIVAMLKQSALSPVSLILGVIADEVPVCVSH